MPGAPDTPWKSECCSLFLSGICTDSSLLRVFDSVVAVCNSSPNPLDIAVSKAVMASCSSSPLASILTDVPA